MSKIIILLSLLGCAALPMHAGPLRVVLVSGSFEYDSDTGLEMLEAYLCEWYDVEISFLRATDWDALPGLQALETCDVALFYTRRLTVDGEALERIRAYAKAGRPLVALRTASHGFQRYLSFDADILGGNYEGHYGHGPTVRTGVTLRGRAHPILEGVGPIRSRYSLYKTKPVADDAEVLMIGQTPWSSGWHPVTWTRAPHGGRVVYSSLGGIRDFEGDSFKRLVANALFWAVDREPARKPAPQLTPWEQRRGAMTIPLRALALVDNDWVETHPTRVLRIENTALLVCDMWDKHWCTFASEHADALAPQINAVLNAGREAGMLIVHAPSDTLGFYAEHPARRRIAEVAPVTPSEVKQVDEPPLPIDDSDGGCPDDDTQYSAWTRQHAAIDIHDTDVISDDGHEVYSYLRRHGIDTIIYMGVHTNMCILGRSFAIRQMTRWGMDCILVRDLTDSMYNPAMKPYVSHDEGTALVVRHIETYWAPTAISEDLINAIRASVPDEQ